MVDVVQSHLRYRRPRSLQKSFLLCFHGSGGVGLIAFGVYISYRIKSGKYLEPQKPKDPGESGATYVYTFSC